MGTSVICICVCVLLGANNVPVYWIRGLKRQERKWSGAACGNAFIRARACSNVLVQFIMCLCL